MPISPANEVLDEPGQLSADEIESLIAQATGRAEPVAPSGPRPYDFRRPNKFSREHVRALQIVHEAFARQLATILSTTLRAVSQVSLASVEQLSYDEYVRSTPNPSLLAILALDPLSGAGIFQVPLPVAMSAIDRLLGGSGTGRYPSRPLTDIESGLMRELLERALGELGTAFESLAPLQPKIVQLEANPQFAQIAAPSDMVVVLTFDTRIGGEGGPLTLCIPFASLHPVLERVAGHSLFADRASGDPAAARAVVASALEPVPVDVRVRFAPVTLASRDIVGLQPGDVLPLHHPVNQPLTVAVGGVPLLAATPGRKGKRLACRIVDLEADQ